MSSPAPELTLLVDAPDGLMIRRVPNASLLPTDEELGPVAESSTRDSAAKWGLPDFVFLPEQQRQGAGVRERGDGLVIADDIAALIQVKARNAVPGSAEREASWLTSNIKKAIKQAKGSIRHLAHRREKLTSARGRRVEIDGALYSWIAVVIVEHPQPPADFTPSLEEAGSVPCVVLLRRDWEFLFDHLRSTRAVLHYLSRVAGEEQELGGEPARYTQAALADADALPKELPDALRRLAGPADAAPAYSAPLAPLEAADDSSMLFRIILEDVANTDIGEDSESDRLELLTALDTLPASYRPELGAALLKFMKSVAQHRGEKVRSESRVFIPYPGDQVPMVFMVTSAHFSRAQPLLSMRTRLLHHEYWSSLQEGAGSTVGVMLTPSRQKNRAWDTSTIWLKGPTGLTEEDAQELRKHITGRI
ncbi:hypothetical protein [Crystallibacter degradans]|uniref:hypothetical protein n=1 Tax=Crystallibacter degradans TaxID=2726743 RepID=UPI00147299AC|nr:hypothetical protein [Arthrobacter sp. SF27]NMR32293.1 hypothetical protein [Arthrobacter sp. SF27]